MKLPVTVCDVCKDVKRATRPWTVIEGDSEHDLDLCNEHSGPLVTLLLAAGASDVLEPSEEVDGGEGKPSHITAVASPPAKRAAAKKAPAKKAPAKKAAKAAPAKKAGRSRRGGAPVVTLAQLEALKSRQD